MTKDFSVLGIKLKSYSMSEIIDKIKVNIKEDKQAFIITANTEIVMLGKKDAEFKKVLENADFVIPDGIGVVWAGRYFGYEVPERVAGFDLAQELLEMANENSLSVFFFGASPGVAQKAMENAKLKYAKLNCVGCRDGFFTLDDTKEIVEQINSARADILFVALGAPKQEKWLHENRHLLKSKILIGVGGTFDVMAGISKRAPIYWQNFGLEWLYRLCKEPKRLGRMLVIPKFMAYVVLNRKH